VSQYQKGKTNLDFTEARDSEWQWHQLGHIMQVCTSLQTDNHASSPPLKCFTGRMPFLPPNQQCQSTEIMSLHYRGNMETQKSHPSNGLPEYNQLLHDFFNIADLQLILTMLCDSINLVM